MKSEKQFELNHLIKKKSYAKYFASILNVTFLNLTKTYPLNELFLFEKYKFTFKKTLV